MDSNQTNISEPHPLGDGQYDVIARLKQSIHESRIEEVAEFDGMRWAKNIAEAIELMRIHETFIDGADETWSFAEKFYFAIAPEFAGNRDAAAAFWKKNSTIKEPSDQYAISFADKAWEVWISVELDVLN